MAFSSVPVINPHTTEGLEARKKALSAWNRKVGALSLGGHARIP